MSWQDPKTDWGTADGVRDFDFNRIEDNTKYLKDIEASSYFNSLNATGDTALVITIPEYTTEMPIGSVLKIASSNIISPGATLNVNNEGAYPILTYSAVAISDIPANTYVLIMLQELNNSKFWSVVGLAGAVPVATRTTVGGIILGDYTYANSEGALTAGYDIVVSSDEEFKSHYDNNWMINGVKAKRILIKADLNLTTLSYSYGRYPFGTDSYDIEVLEGAGHTLILQSESIYLQIQNIRNITLTYETFNSNDTTINISRNKLYNVHTNGMFDGGYGTPSLLVQSSVLESCSAPYFKGCSGLYDCIATLSMTYDTSYNYMYENCLGMYNCSANVVSNVSDTLIDVFSGCSKIVNCDIKIGLLGDNTLYVQNIFDNCFQLSDVRITCPNQQTPNLTIEQALNACYRVNNLQLSSSHLFSGSYMFGTCTEISNISLLVMVESNVFSNCENISNVTISTASNQGIQIAFNNCNRVSNVQISVPTTQAFTGCNYISNIQALYIGDITNCTWLSNINSGGIFNACESLSNCRSSSNSGSANPFYNCKMLTNCSGTIVNFNRTFGECSHMSCCIGTQLDCTYVDTNSCSAN